MEPPYLSKSIFEITSLGTSGVCDRERLRLDVAGVAERGGHGDRHAGGPKRVRGCVKDHAVVRVPGRKAGKGDLSGRHVAIATANRSDTRVDRE